MYHFQAVKMARAQALDRKTFYGIVAQEQAEYGWTPVLIAGNISCNPEFVCNLADRCTREQLDPCHLADVVRDAILLSQLEGTFAK